VVTCLALLEIFTAVLRLVYTYLLHDQWASLTGKIQQLGLGVGGVSNVDQLRGSALVGKDIGRNLPEK
jgi:hypothetical protein